MLLNTKVCLSLNTELKVITSSYTVNVRVKNNVLCFSFNFLNLNLYLYSFSYFKLRIRD